MQIVHIDINININKIFPLKVLAMWLLQFQTCLTFVLMSKVKYFLKDNFILHNHSSKGAQKNMQQVWNFNEDKLPNRYFRNNLNKFLMLPDSYFC